MTIQATGTAFITSSADSAPTGLTPPSSTRVPTVTAAAGADMNNVRPWPTDLLPEETRAAPVLGRT